jgi:iron complex outermembrane recepter protein
MRVRQGSGSAQLALVIALAGSWIGGWVFPAQASTLLQPASEQREGDRSVLTPTLKRTDGKKVGLQPITNIRHINDQTQPATTVKDWVAQIEAATVQVTGVKLERTETGLDIVLDTAEGKPLQVDATRFRSEGNTLIADIPNAVLVLPEGQTFAAENPTEEIAIVQVVQQDGDSIRVSVTGKDGVPTEEVTLRTGVLAYSLNPEADEPDEEIVVTGGRDGYRVPNASVGTRTDTPLRDIPQSIQVIPQQVIRDQQVTSLGEALQNVSGISRTSSSQQFFEGFTIRGFESGRNILRNGLLDDTTRAPSFEPSGIERLEVLKGPASVLYGNGLLGGVINLVTKQPLSEPYYAVTGSAGNFDFYRGAFDISGPLTEDRKVLYRLNAAALSEESFIDFFSRQRYYISPVISWQVSDRTKLTFDLEYLDQNKPYYFGIPIQGSILSNPNGEIPRNRTFGERDDEEDTTTFRVGYDLEHRFSDNWQLRNTFRASFLRLERDFFYSASLARDNRTVNRVNTVQDFRDDYYNVDTYVSGRFTTGSIQHQLVAGINYNNLTTRVPFGETRTAAAIDLFNPVYGNRTIGNRTFLTQDFRRTIDSYGFYIQNQITFADNLKVLLGGRFDILSASRNESPNFPRFSQTDDAFSPRAGIVYQPIPPISLYASFSQSFQQPIGLGSAPNPEPERGTQYEVGVKVDFNDKLAATLAFYDLARTNVSTVDPNNLLLSIQVGEQKSQGIELDIAGELLPGWNIFAGYAYTDARIVRDNRFDVGNQLSNVPLHSFNLWTTYEIQRGSLKGFGVGVGLFFVGERQGDLANTFRLPSYLRTDAAIFYTRDRLRIGLNFKNLFNVDYFESATSQLNVFPGAPFTVQGTISWQF